MPLWLAEMRRHDYTGSEEVLPDPAAAIARFRSEITGIVVWDPAAARVRLRRLDVGWTAHALPTSPDGDRQVRATRRRGPARALDTQRRCLSLRVRSVLGSHVPARLGVGVPAVRCSAEPRRDGAASRVPVLGVVVRGSGAGGRSAGRVGVSGRTAGQDAGQRAGDGLADVRSQRRRGVHGGSTAVGVRQVGARHGIHIQRQRPQRDSPAARSVSAAGIACRRVPGARCVPTSSTSAPTYSTAAMPTGTGSSISARSGRILRAVPYRPATA